MPYELVKAMKIQTADGKVELRQAGLPCPEADTWPNPAVWIKRGFIRPIDHETALKSGYARDKLKPMVPAGPAAVARATSLVPVPGKPLPGVLDEDQDTISELKKMKREDLDKLAAKHEVADPASYPNKGELAKAVLAKVKPDAPPDASSDALVIDESLLAELLALDRSELDALATDQGVENPASLEHKAVAEAVLAAAG